MPEPPPPAPVPVAAAAPVPAPASFPRVDHAKRIVHIVIIVAGEDWNAALTGIRDRMRHAEPIQTMGVGAYLHVPLPSTVLEHWVELHLYAGTAIDTALEARADGLILAGREVPALLGSKRLLTLPTAMLGTASKRQGLFAVAVTPMAVFTNEDIASGFDATREVTKGVFHGLQRSGALQAP